MQTASKACWGTLNVIMLKLPDFCAMAPLPCGSFQCSNSKFVCCNRRASISKVFRLFLLNMQKIRRFRAILQPPCVSFQGFLTFLAQKPQFFWVCAILQAQGAKNFLGFLCELLQTSSDSQHSKKSHKHLFQCLRTFCQKDDVPICNENASGSDFGKPTVCSLSWLSSSSTAPSSSFVSSCSPLLYGEFGWMQFLFSIFSFFPKSSSQSLHAKPLRTENLKNSEGFSQVECLKPLECDVFWTF